MGCGHSKEKEEEEEGGLWREVTYRRKPEEEANKQTELEEATQLIAPTKKVSKAEKENEDKRLKLTSIINENFSLLRRGSAGSTGFESILRLVRTKSLPVLSQTAGDGNPLFLTPKPSKRVHEKSPRTLTKSPKSSRPLSSPKSRPLSICSLPFSKSPKSSARKINKPQDNFLEEETQCQIRKKPLKLAKRYAQSMELPCPVPYFPRLEGVTKDLMMKWKTPNTGFELLLSSSAGRTLFNKFLEKEFSCENLQFWIVCENLKKIKGDKEFLEHVDVIFRIYIISTAVDEVVLVIKLICNFFSNQGQSGRSSESPAPQEQGQSHQAHL